MTAQPQTSDDKPTLHVVPSNPRLIVDEIIVEITDEYLDQIDPEITGAPLPPVWQMKQDLIDRVNRRFGIINADLKGHDRVTRLKALTNSQIARLLMRLHHVVNIKPSRTNTNRRYDLLGIYADKGPDEGIYLTSEISIRAIGRQYNHELTINAGNEILAILEEIAPRVERCTERDLVPVNNGIFHYETKELLPFTPEKILLSKSRVRFDFNAQSPVIYNADDGTSWEVEEWVNELTEDPEVLALLWQIMGAVIRPLVRWNKSAWFYSEMGNNGKGTLAELMRNLVGSESCVSIPLADFGTNFMLEPLTNASAIIVDENDVDQYIDKAANIKAVITNDVISVNRKGLTPISYQFWGFMVQCLNSFPKFSDKSESFYRRQLFVPFKKSFTGVERKYIKDDYLSRPEVLEYVLMRVLTQTADYYSLDEPAACLEVLNSYKESNDPVREFWNEFENIYVWDLLPFGYLYDHYLVWSGKTNPSGKPLGRNRYKLALLGIVSSSKTWYCADSDKAVRAGKKMSKPELLTLKYGLDDWKQAGYAGKDPLQMCIPTVAASYRGLQRYAPTSGGTDDDNDTDGTDGVASTDTSVVSS